MPLDPNIPLGVAPLAPQQQQNPIAMIGQWAQVQSQLNQNKLFQQTFAARQKAGQILAAAPDLETGLSNLIKDPFTAPFAGEYMNSVRQAAMAQAQVDKLKAETGEVFARQGTSAIDSFKKGLPLVLVNPTDETWNQLAESALSVTNPTVRPAVLRGIDSLKKSLLDGLPDDPEARRKQVMKNFVALSIPSGLPLGGLDEIFGKNDKIEGGGYIQPTLKTPSYVGGGENAVGGAFGKTLPPTIVTQPGGIPDVFGGGGAGARANPLVPRSAPPSPAGGNLLSPRPTIAPRPRADVDIIGADGKPSASGDLAARQRAGEAPLYETGPPESENAYDGTPLIPAGSITETQNRVGVSAGGMNVLSPAQQKGAEKLMESFQGEELAIYQNNIASLGSLDRMDHALESMSATGGIIQPGAFGAARLEIAKNLNLIGDFLGTWDSSKPISETNKPPVDANAIASAEDLLKEATRTGMLFVNQTMGAQREAASIIQGAIKATPGLENTLLGGRLVSRSLRAVSQRLIDQRKFQEAWALKKQGDLSGSITAFNKAHPGRKYLETVLQSMGMDEGGFQTPQDIQRAFKDGYLTKGEATGFLHQQFPDLFKKPGEK